MQAEDEGLVLVMDQSAAQQKILCIDDSPEMRTLARRLLSSRYTILEATDGLQGIELATSSRPDLILMDLHMPQLTGYEVATRIKSLMPEVPIIAVTSDVTLHVRERALAAGCDGYMSKPIDPDEFVEQVEAVLAGQRELLEDDTYRQAYHETLVARLEEKVRALTVALHRNADLNKRNLELLTSAQRQTKLLEASARVGRSITSILDLDELLSATVDVICVEFDLYYAGVFLLDETGEWAVLRSGQGKAGDALIASGYQVRVGGPSPVGAATARRTAVVSRRTDEQPPYAANPHLPGARAEVALPLVMGNTLLGALTVQSVEETAFSADDVTTLQVMADQLAIAINNTRLVKDLDVAHDELMRTKTFQVIATATGEAIHWVGNKAAPIPASVKRITEDIVRYLVMAYALVEQAPPELREGKFAQLLADAAEEIDRRKLLEPLKSELEAQPLDRLRKTLSVESIFEDLTIIENSGRSILNIKEDLIGPARQRKLEAVSLPDLLQETVASMGIPAGVVRTLYAQDLLPARADKVQLGRVFTNLVKNAMEAMHKTEDKKLFIWARMADEPGFAVVEVNDNGSGISPDQIDKIWMAFYTTKGDRGGTGLGLPACAQIVGQVGGKIMVESEVGVGTTFSVFLPVVQEN